MNARRLGFVLGAIAAVLLVLSGLGGHRLALARADDPLEPTTSVLEPTTRDTTPDTEPSTQPDTPATEPPRPTTTRRGARTSTTQRARAGSPEPTETTEAAVAEPAPETTLPPDTTITEAPTTTERTRRVALPSGGDGDTRSMLPIIASVLGALGIGGGVLAEITVRRRRAVQFGAPPETIVLPAANIAAASPATNAVPTAAAVAAPAAAAAAAPASEAIAHEETVRERRKRERRERAHAEHEAMPAPRGEADRVVAAAPPQVAKAEPARPSVAPPPPPPASPPPPPPAAPPQVFADPYEEMDLTPPAEIDPGMPDLRIDLSDPEL